MSVLSQLKDFIRFSSSTMAHSISSIRASSFCCRKTSRSSFSRPTINLSSLSDKVSLIFVSSSSNFLRHNFTHWLTDRRVLGYLYHRDDISLRFFSTNEPVRVHFKGPKFVLDFESKSSEKVMIGDLKKNSARGIWVV